MWHRRNVRQRRRPSHVSRGQSRLRELLNEARSMVRNVNRSIFVVLSASPSVARRCSQLEVIEHRLDTGGVFVVLLREIVVVRFGAQRITAPRRVHHALHLLDGLVGHAFMWQRLFGAYWSARNDPASGPGYLVGSGHRAIIRQYDPAYFAKPCDRGRLQYSAELFSY